MLVGSTTTLVAISRALFTCSSVVQMFVRSIASIPRVYRNNLEKGILVPWSICYNKSSTNRQEGLIDLVLLCNARNI